MLHTIQFSYLPTYIMYITTRNHDTIKTFILNELCNVRKGIILDLYMKYHIMHIIHTLCISVGMPHIRGTYYYFIDASL